VGPSGETEERRQDAPSLSEGAILRPVFSSWWGDLVARREAPAASPAFGNGLLVIDGESSPGSTDSEGAAAGDFLQVAGGEMHAFTEGNVLVKTDATLGGAGGEIGLHVVCTWSPGGRSRRRPRVCRGAIQRANGAESGCGRESLRGRLIASVAGSHCRHAILKGGGIAERRDNRSGHLSFRVWGSGRAVTALRTRRTERQFLVRRSWVGWVGV